MPAHEVGIKTDQADRYLAYCKCGWKTVPSLTVRSIQKAADAHEEPHRCHWTEVSVHRPHWVSPGE
jgi:hypothetical protein